MYSHIHSNVAKDNNGQGKEATCNHEYNHVGLDSRIFTSTEHIRSAGSLQAMGPVPDGWKDNNTKAMF